jgi:ATP-dependent helicase HrpA
MAVLQLLQECMHANAKIRALLEPSLMGWASANRADAKAHLQRLIYPGFLTKTEPALLQHLPRFLKALQTRLERALQDPVKDQTRMLDLQAFNAALQNPALRETADFAAFRLAVEELNVQVYAQELSPKGVVSRKAVAKQLARLISHA